MLPKNIKNLIYALVALASLTAGVYFFIPRTNDQFMETSVLTVMKAMNNDLDTSDKPDLAIESVDLKKISDPTSDFNYYKFSADITVRNLGGTLVNSSVVIHGDDKQKYEFIRNTRNGFYLQKNGLFTIKDYKVLLDGKYNGGKVPLTIEVKDKDDSFLSNNTYLTDAFEPPAKIKSFAIKEISENKSFVLDFENYSLDENSDLQIYATKSFNVPESALKYAEIAASDKVYGYYQIQNSAEIVNSSSWKKLDNFNKNNLSIKFVSDPFNDIDEHYLYAKIVDSKTGNYAVSNIIKLPRYKEISNEDFIKYMIEFTDKNVVDNGIAYYKNIAGSESYDSQVKSLYDEQLGNLSDSGEKITRAEVLKTVMDFYGLQLSTTSNKAHFEDVPESHPLYPYAETLYSTGKWYVFGYSLNPDAPATKEFLNYLAENLR